MSCRAAAHLVWSMGKTGYYRHPTLTAVMQTYADKFMGTLSEAELAQLLHGFAQLGYRPEIFLITLSGAWKVDNNHDLHAATGFFGQRRLRRAVCMTWHIVLPSKQTPAAYLNRRFEWFRIK